MYYKIENGEIIEAPSAARVKVSVGNQEREVMMYGYNRNIEQLKNDGWQEYAGNMPLKYLYVDSAGKLAELSPDEIREIEDAEKPVKEYSKYKIVSGLLGTPQYDIFKAILSATPGAQELWDAATTLESTNPMLQALAAEFAAADPDFDTAKFLRDCEV